MRDYAVDDYGLLLDEETIKVIASKVIDDFSYDATAIDWAYELYDHGICEYISEFTGEAQEIDNNGFYWGGEINEYSNDVIAYVQAYNYPTLFRRAYNNMDELVEEFKNKLGEYLPDDFDYRSRIRHICGTYYG
jgi:hypothetical protein